MRQRNGKLGVTKIRHGWGLGIKGDLDLKWGHRKMAGVELRQQFQENPTKIKHIKLEEGSPAEISEQGHSHPAGLDMFPEIAAEADRKDLGIYTF